MDQFPDPTEVLRAVRTAVYTWFNAPESAEAIWDLVEAFETLDALLLAGHELPDDWKKPDEIVVEHVRRRRETEYPRISA